MSTFRLATQKDLPCLLELYEKARLFMASYGNDQQWKPGYPGKELLLEDIKKKELYCLEIDGSIEAAFVFYDHIDPCYKVIYEGEWRNDEPYGVLHRVVSSGNHPKLGDQIIQFGFSKMNNLRIDTHEKNIPMQRLLQRNGFEKTGTILLANGQPRWAYHGIKN